MRIISADEARKLSELNQQPLSERMQRFFKEVEKIATDEVLREAGTNTSFDTREDFTNPETKLIKSLGYSIIYSGATLSYEISWERPIDLQQASTN